MLGLTGQSCGRDILDVVAHQSQVAELCCGIEQSTRQLSDLVVIGKQSVQTGKESNFTRHFGQPIVVQVQLCQV